MVRFPKAKNRSCRAFFLVSLILAVTLAGIAAGNDAGPDEPASGDRLQPLRFLVGACWQGRFPDGGNTDTHCYREFYDGAFIRDTHLVRGSDPDYRGETIYHWDSDSERIAFRYWNSLGGVSDGWVQELDGRLLFPRERHVADDGSVLQIRSFIEPISNDRYISTAEQSTPAGWKEMWRMEFNRSGPADELDEGTPGLPRLNAAATLDCKPLLQHDFAFTSRATGNSEIHLYRAQGPAIRRLTATDFQSHWATWSPDGDRFAFQTLRDGNREVYVTNSDGSGLRNVTGHPEQDLVPSWSPDGRRIAFFSSRAKPWPGTGPLGGHIFLMDADGTQPRQLPLAAILSATSINWSPDGKRIVYARYTEDAQGIYAYDLALETETRLPTPGPDGTVGSPAYSPDGRQIAFYRSRDTGADVWVMPAIGGAGRRITNGTGHHYDAAWSPDGTALLVTSSANGKEYDIRCMAVDGSFDVPVIDDAADARTAAWRPGPGSTRGD